MHICFPFHNSAQFTAAVVDLIRRFDPQVTIINSTVAPGTTVAVARAAVCYSPVRGKHAEMAKALLHYVKFVAGTEARAVDAAVEHFNAVDMKIRRVSTADTLELAKLAETNLLRSLHRFCAGVETLRAGDRSQLRRSSPLFRGDRVPAASDLFSGNNRRPLRHSQHRPCSLESRVRHCLRLCSIQTAAAPRRSLPSNRPAAGPALMNRERGWMIFTRKPEEDLSEYIAITPGRGRGAVAAATDCVHGGSDSVWR
ncbi:MAG: hypothetical protein ABSF85_00055 [Terriglobales bacterium]